ncbi:uncharacterized HTH-type transcriptional regulator YjiR-like isoform X1 [Mytilus edulis]|uniref:uncharacterized HTH-type transcriptional regulator YjiR-like isoform X1 n=1 Tax=Mytilus edulis TaxID=6550 RepID=UPI0039F03982
MAKQSKRDLFEDLELYNEKEDNPVIPLAMGAPGTDTISGCKEILLESTRITLTNEDEKYIFQYGPMKGDPDFLDELARFLSSEYGNDVDSDNLMATAGATQGLHLTASVMFDRSTPVFVEDPTYFIAIKILREDLGMNIIPVPTDGDGIIPEALETAIKEKVIAGSETKTPFKGMVYLMTTFSNPRGISTSPERCRRLVHLARKYDMLLFTEDVYNLLSYTGTCPPPRLMFYDDKNDDDFKGNVLSNGTFSKILAPGIRLGWIEAPERILELVAKCNTSWSGGCFNHYASRLMTTALKQGMLTKHLHKIRSIYARRMNLLYDLLCEDFPVTIVCEKPKGGFFLWAELPSSLDSKLLLQIGIEKHGVNFIIGSSTSPTESYKNCIRLSISFCDDEKLKRGVQKLKDAVREYQSIWGQDK